MKKSKIKLLTATACLALIGTASAAWVYAGTATASANIGVKVASYASAGDITVTGADNYYLYLDYGSVTWKQKDESINLVATHNAPANLSTNSKTPTLTYTITLKSYFSETVKFSDTNINNDAVENDGTYTRVSNDITWTSGEAITLPELEWNIIPNEGDYQGQTFDKSLVVEDYYQSFIIHSGGPTFDDTWDKTVEIDLTDLITINFKAVI